MRDLVKEFEFTSNRKFNVKVYENRVEINSSGAGNFLSKGITGTATIFLKHLTALEFKLEGSGTTGYLEFLCPGYVHQESTLKKVGADNVILFSKKEHDQALELYNLINTLV